MSSSTKTVTGFKVSLVLDRRSFLVSAGMAAGVVAVAARASWSIAAAGEPERTAEATNVSDVSMEWAADHIFGTYPPYAHPIPHGRRYAPPVSFDEGSFDPVLMI
jgi:hypothetical protein